MGTGELPGERPGVAEFLQRQADRVFPRLAFGRQFGEPFFEVNPQFLRNVRLLRGVQPEEFRQQRQVDFEFGFGHGIPCYAIEKKLTADFADFHRFKAKRSPQKGAKGSKRASMRSAAVPFFFCDFCAFS